MDILQEIIIGMVGCAISHKIERYITDKIKLKWLCWILTFIITLIIIVILLLLSNLIVADLYLKLCRNS